MAFRLCLALGVRSPDRLWDELSWKEWTEWQEFWDLEPWGDQRHDLRQVALLVSIFAAWSGAHHGLPDATYPYFAVGAINQEATGEALTNCLATIKAQAARRGQRSDAALERLEHG